MNSVFSSQRAPTATIAIFTLLLGFSLLPAQIGVAQPSGAVPLGAPAPSSAPETGQAWFHLKREPIAGGAELLTIFGSLDGLPRQAEDKNNIPLVSLLRDTLGDDDPVNDRLRYIWMLTYTSPSIKQRLASGIPFLYNRVGNKQRVSPDQLPTALFDVASPKRDFWQRVMWLALQNVLIDPSGLLAKTSIRSFRRNADDYRKAHIIRALAILSLYEAESGAESVFTPVEKREIQGRLMLSEKMLGGFVDDTYLHRVYAKQTSRWQDMRGHNWELLRQRAEAEGLYFEPLQMPDGNATHALVWVARSDLQKNFKRAYDKRFLNISCPWQDQRLLNWNGFVETRYFDANNYPVTAETAGARAVEMIPLALYGLDNPKIPSLLVDFRDATNAKRREMSRRVIEDVTRNILSISPFGDLHYFLGRALFDFVTDKRGMDINQPSRLRAYSQLKLLLALNASLDPALRDEIGRRLERLSLNPLENDLQIEAKLAQVQYEALLADARRANGLPAKLDRARRAEMVPHTHGRVAQMMFRVAHIASLGIYSHREQLAPEALRAQLDTKRRFAYHRHFLREVAKSSPLVEVIWKIEDVRHALHFIAEHGARADGKTTSAVALIFARTQDEETRRLCLNSLYRINNEMAKKELLRIYQNPELDPSLRTLSAELLRAAIREDKHIAPSDAKAIVSVIGQ